MNGIALSLAICLLAPQATPETEQPKLVNDIAVLPFMYQDGTDTAVKTAEATLNALLKAALCKPRPEEEVMAVWFKELRQPEIQRRVKARKYFPDLPSAATMLKLGQSLGVRFVVAGRCKWETTSKWVTLGPKTKAYATVDIVIVDVPNREIDVEKIGMMADSTKKEK